MRSLNTSLPRPRSRSRNPNRPELIQAFKGAALAVTNLYKSAVANESRSRTRGYQSALEDLLSFLDAENLGLQDGEGWVIRQWATGRFEGERESEGVESEEERGDTEKEKGTTKGSSPVRLERVKDEANTTESVQLDRRPPEPVPEVVPETEPDAPKPPIFTFTANTTLIRDVTMQTPDSDQQPPTEPATEPPISHHTPLRVELKTKPSRIHKGRTSTRLSNRDPNLVGSTKRKLNFPDFFDISPDGGREGPGERKRGRFS